MATYVNDLRLKEIATGDESGTWGTSTNTNLELIAEAFSFGTEAITTNADTHTTTIADGSTDPGRSIYLKYTGTLDSACTITIGPNTVSKLWFIENGTSGSQNIIISQGSGANVTIPPGDVKAVYSDGAGSGAAIVDAFASLNVVDLKVEDDLTVTDDASIGGDATITGTLGVSGLITANANLTLAGTTPTLTIGDAGAEDTKIVFDGNAQDFYIALDDSADDLIVGLGSTVGTTPIISLTEAGAVTLKNVGTGDDNPMSLTLQTSETDIAADDVLGKISFQAPDEGTGTDANLVAAAIQAISEGDFSASSNATSLAFMTGASEAATTKMTVTSGGHIGIGMTPAPVGSDTVLSIFNSGTPRIKLHNSTTGSASGDGGEINMSSGNLILENREAGEIQFFTNGSERASIKSGGTTEIVGILDHLLYGQYRSAGAGSTISGYIGRGSSIVSGGTATDMGVGGGAGNLVFAAGGTTERMRIASDGTVGIGETSPDSLLHIKNSASDSVAGISLENDARRYAINVHGGLSDGLAIFNAGAGETQFFIASGGNVGIGADNTSPDSVLSVKDATSDPIMTVHKNSTGVSDAVVIRHGRGLSGFVGTGIDFQRNDGTTVGSVVIGFSSTAYNTSSDYRLKENVTYTWDATTRLKQLKPARFTFKDDTSDLVDGFLAHEVSSIVPEAITGEKDAVDSEGNPEYQSIDQSKLVPLLVKTIQELEARITALES